MQASALQGSWENFGPRLEIADIQAALADGGSLQIRRVTLALDIWQSLLHLRWQFRDLTFWHFRLATNTPLSFGGGRSRMSLPNALTISFCVSLTISPCATAKSAFDAFGSARQPGYSTADLDE